MEKLDVADRLARCYSGAVYDALRARGLKQQVLPTSIRAIDASYRMAGPAFTVSGHPDDTLDPHETLMAWTGFLSAAPRGCVVVCQPNDSMLAHMGELSGETLMARGIRGYLADGGCRDTEFLRKIQFPVWCRYLTPADIVGRWTIDALGAPIQIGKVTIRTGDWLLADRDGVVVIPETMVDEVLAAGEELMNTESVLRSAIRNGADPQHAYLEHGVF